MVIFATPDFGASGIIALFLLIAWAVVLALAGGGLLLGARLLSRGSAKLGWLLVLASCFLPIFCYAAPPHIVRLVYGNYPLGSYPTKHIQAGMSSRDQVQRVLGPPHERYKYTDRETWIYWIDSYGAYYCGVDFGPDGRVTSTYGN